MKGLSLLANRCSANVLHSTRFLLASKCSPSPTSMFILGYERLALPPNSPISYGKVTDELAMPTLRTFLNTQL